MNPRIENRESRIETDNERYGKEPTFHIRGSGGVSSRARIPESNVSHRQAIAGRREIWLGQSDSPRIPFAYKQYCGGSWAISLSGSDKIYFAIARLFRGI